MTCGCGGARQLGEGMAAALMAANDTSNTTAEALVGAFFVAGRTCGPPNALSSHSFGEARSKYVTSTCYFIGPVLAAPLRNPMFQQVLQATADARVASDSWGSGALLGAMLDCAAGGLSAQRPPSWLYQGLGPLPSPAVAGAHAPAQSPTTVVVASSGRRLMA